MFKKYFKQQDSAWLMALFVFLFYVAFFIVSAIGCHVRWDEAGYRGHYSFGGCEVEISKDRWVPEANIKINVDSK